MSDIAAMTTLPSVLTLRDAPATLGALEAAFAAEGSDVWRIDAAPVTQLDTSALAVLLACARMAAAAGKRLEINSVPARLLELARLYEVDMLLGMDAETPA